MDYSDRCAKCGHSLDSHERMEGDYYCIDCEDFCYSENDEDLD